MLALLLLAGVVFAISRLTVDRSLPDTIAGLPRMQTSAAKEFESSFDAFPADADMRGSWYGSGPLPQLMVVTFDPEETMGGYSPESSLSTRGSILMSRPGLDPRTFDPESVRTLDHGEASYSCLAFRVSSDPVPLGVPDPEPRIGATCLWTMGDERSGMIAWSPPDLVGDPLVEDALRIVTMVEAATS